MQAATENLERKSGIAGNDARLIREYLSGNEEAWSLLIDKYKALIYSVPFKSGLSSDEAADVFQATCMELLVRLAELREPRALPKWLLQVAYHECGRWKRQSQRMISRDSGSESPEPETPAVADTLLQQVCEEQVLREAVATLSPRCRRLVDLLFLKPPPRPYAEVARELGLAVGSIGFTRQRCIEQLRRKLDDLGFECYP